MNPPDSNQLTTPETELPKHHVRNPLEVMQPGEQVICEVKRHPIGMLGIYIAAGAVLIVLAIIIFIVAPHAVSSNSRGAVLGAGSLLYIVAAAIIVAFVFISNKVYWGNSWVVTSDSLTQIVRTSLFHKQSAQLSLGNLEDVTSEKNGILSEMFNFGVLRAETAGERSKFVFLFCPHPDEYAQKILAAREQFEQLHHGGKQAPYYENDQPRQGFQAPENSQGQPPVQAYVPPQPVPQPPASGFAPAQPPAVPTTYTPAPVVEPQPSDRPSYEGDNNGVSPVYPYAPPSQSAPPSERETVAPLYPDTPPSFKRDNEI